jgi:hypothetical protein
MGRVEPDDDLAAGAELMDNEVSHGEYTMVDTMCGCWQKGGNTLTLTDKRVVIKYWDNALGGLIEASMVEESFDYEDVVHVVASAGRSLILLLIGGLLELAGIIFLIYSFTVDSFTEQTNARYAGAAGIVLGLLILIYFFMGKGKAFVTLDMTKDKEVGSFSAGLFSWDTLKNPFSAIFSAGKPRRHVTCVLKLSKKDALAATSKICAMRQGLKEKLSRVL